MQTAYAIRPLFCHSIPIHSFQHTGRIFTPAVLCHVLAAPDDTHALAFAPIIIVTAQIIRDYTQFSAHKLRHTAATMMLSGGVDVKTVQEVLGHENLNTTQIYTHIENTELKIAAEANPIARLDLSDE